MSATDFVVDRGALENSKFVESPLSPEMDLKTGSILLKLAQFALTANNITYTMFGDALGYWNFFPTSEPGHARMPVWGFADVIRSEHPEIAKGERVFGFLPISTYLEIDASGVEATHFSDASPHRAALHPWYNRYTRCRADPSFDSATHDLQPVLWPLFMTGWLLSELLESNAFFGANQIFVSSASSKTAFSFAHSAKSAAGDGVQLIGLTSSRNRDFVRSLGCYDEVVSYEEVDTLKKSGRAIFVDMAGNQQLRHQIHSLYGDDLSYSATVGATHTSGETSADPLPGPTPSFFFVPNQAELRASEWGREDFSNRFAQAWKAFVPTAIEHLELRHAEGSDAIQQGYLTARSGALAPNQALLFKP
jgi:hypothetical protein